MSLKEFAPAAALLIESGRRSLGAPSHGAAAAAHPADWGALPRAAERHGMSAWVQAAATDWPDTPRAVGVLVSDAAHRQRLRALQAAAQLSSIGRQLTDAGVDAVSIKGPLFSRWLYGDVGMRRFADLDLLVRPADRARALAALGSAGYALPGGLSAAAAGAVYAGTGAWPLIHETAIGVDLHWKLQAVGFGAPLQPLDVLRDRAYDNVAGVEIGMPSATHAAALTLLHAAKHLWASLELALSIAHLMRRDDVDWPRVHELTARAGAWNGCAAGLALAGELFDVDPPPPLRDRIRPPAVRPLVDAAVTFLAMPDVAGAPLRAELAAHRAGLDSARARLRYTAWRLFAPTPLEAAWCRLPDRLVALYAPIRLLRLAIRHRAR